MKEENLLAYLYELHDNTPRQGPGSRESTLRAYNLCAGMPEEPLILDLGCGTGAQTLDLARLGKGRIVAVDNHQPFLDVLQQKAIEKGLNDRILPRQGDMADPPVPEAPFDLIWSEGAIFIVGFDRGLALWRNLLKPGGCLALTELCWLRPDIPTLCREFWQTSYPPIRSVEANLAAARKAGYRVLADFTLPKRCWLEEYYAPLRGRIEEMSRKYRDDKETEALVEMTRTEIRMYERYSDYSGYQFYILRRSDKEQ